MKTTIILLAVSLFSNLSNAQVLNEEMIVGLWKSGNQKVMVKIDRLGSIYQGRIIWLSDSGGGQDRQTFTTLSSSFEACHLSATRLFKRCPSMPMSNDGRGAHFMILKVGKLIVASYCLRAHGN
jgi:hypothetical protein